ncbi:MAG: MlaD family protein [Chlamydiae bacterium]|nr:MlaD family protein [Chlamydiota bacterium]
MNGYLKNLLIGIFVVAAIGIFVSLILFLKPAVGDMEKTLIVRFSDINRINVGTRVLFAGKPVGEVVKIREIINARDQPTDELGRVYFYELVLKIDSSVNVYNTDELAIQTSGLLGEKSIAIIPKAPPKGVIPKLITNEPIYADSVDPFENALHEFSNLSQEIEDTFREVNKWIKTHGEEMATTINSIRSTVEEIDQTMTTVNETCLVDAIKEGVNKFDELLAKTTTGVDELIEGNTFKNFGKTIENLKGASESIEMISDDIAQGKGTLGKWIAYDDLYLRVNGVLSKMNVLMNDINHYGILFHLNKSWQRLRTQRVNLLQALDSPSEFKDYFSQEVDQINTSMSRLSLLLDRAQECPEKEEIFHTNQFQKEFAELLRQADELTEQLKLYNQQLMEAQGN